MRNEGLLLVGGAVLLAACGSNPEPIGTTELASTAVMIDDIGLGSAASALSDVASSGEMAGIYRTASGVHAFRLLGDTFTDIHPSGSTHSWAKTISPTGAVGGHIDYSAAVWPAGGGAPVVIPMPSGVFSYVNELNSSSQGVGTWTDAGGFQRAFFWSATTGRIDIGDLGGDRMIAHRINDLGQIVGWSTQVPGNSTLGHAISWQSGVLTDLGTLGGPFSSASDVNDHGLIVGAAQTSSGVYHACVWIGGAITDLDPSAVESSYALAVNNHGHIAGIRLVGGQKHATLWRDGGAIDLGAGPGSHPIEIDDAGVIVGIRVGAPGFVWANPVDGSVDLPAPLGAPQRTTAIALGAGMAVGWASSDPSYLQSDWRAAIWTLSITPPAADEAIGVLDDAVADSPLGASEVGALDAKLAAAARQCERGNETAARNQINAFIQQVHAFASAGKLTAQEASDLIALANEVLDELSC